jgi:hypothetical protein
VLHEHANAVVILNEQYARQLNYPRENDGDAIKRKPLLTVPACRPGDF